ncbi:MAG: bifunctional diaminohydroxyphosphoribosylaminopyrimidine deaminase/5-amino-6-(5-phosphoribosylamino)uracil reductase RibD [Steroidobacteraceae bacterium]
MNPPAGEFVSSAADERHMRRALELARHGLYSTDPNPRVGCVLVRNGATVGEGWHERAGEAHAEVHALQSAGPAAQGATAYVTLEPCAGHGRTPPCVQALLAAQVARVVYAAGDPNPRMQGGGSLLAAAGVEVQGGLLRAEARALNAGFFKRIETGLPWVRVKLGASLDGRTALANGASRWITSPAARKDAQTWRARSSVVLSGIGTILGDDPALNVRLPGATRQPLRVVLDSQLRTPVKARTVYREGEGCALILGALETFNEPQQQARAAALRARGAQVEALPSSAPGQLDLQALLRRLAERQANEIWVEAGAQLAGAFIAAGLVDELIVYVAPCLLGPDARPLAQLPRLEKLEDRYQFRLGEVLRIEDDLRLQYLRTTPG